jgi:PAP2 superfamily protein
MTPEAEAAWRLLLLNWLLTAAMIAALGLSIAITEFSIVPSSLVITCGFVAAYGGFAYANARSPSRRDPQVMFVLGATAQVVLIIAVMTPLTYVAAATNLPLQDENLLVVDRMLGLDWLSYASFVNDHPQLASWLTYGYSMIRWPIFAIPVVLAAKGHYQRIGEFTFAFGVALIATTVVSALVPAIGVYQQIGLDPARLPNLNVEAYLQQLRDLPLTRDGVLRQLDLSSLAGIVTFPSFHAASAVLYGWALWSARWMRPIALLANGAMLAATPVNGGHYFIDLIAGIAVAVLAVIAARWVGNRILNPRVSRAAAPVVVGVAAAACPSAAVGAKNPLL